MLDVMFYEAFDEEKKVLSNLLPDTIQADYTPNSIQEHKEKDLSAKIICIRTQSDIPDKWKTQVQGILTRSQGYDHILRMFSSTNPKPSLGYLGGYCSTSVAEHAILCMLALTKKFKKQILQFEQFNRDGITGVEAKNRNVLVVGVGKIGTKISQLSKALGMNVKGVDINPTYKEIEYIDINEGICWADIVFCALPLTDTTNRLLNYDLLSKNPKGIYLINISRGEITPIDDVCKMIDDRTILGLCLDVFENEVELANNLRDKNTNSEDIKTLLKLSEKDNVICTPHNAFNTQESVLDKSKVTVESIIHFLENQCFIHSVPSE